jgi:GT2 family glycosyltransferase
MPACRTHTLARLRSYLPAVTALPAVRPADAVAVEAVSGAFMLVRRSAIEEVALMDEGYFLHCEDLDWCMRFRERGQEVLFVPQVAVVHH